MPSSSAGRYEFCVDDAFESTDLKPLVPVEVRPDELPADDDSQQVAEAMIQLGNAGSYLGDQPVQQHGKYFYYNYYYYYYYSHVIILY